MKGRGVSADLGEIMTDSDEIMFAHVEVSTSFLVKNTFNAIINKTSDVLVLLDSTTKISTISV